MQHSLCRIDDGVLDANTKVNGDGSENFKHFFFSLYLFLGMSKASDNTKATMNKQIRRIHPAFSQVGS